MISPISPPTTGPGRVDVITRDDGTLDQGVTKAKRTKAILLKNCKDASFTLDASLRVAKLFVENCTNVVVTVRCVVITQHLEVWNCAETTLRLDAPVATVQADRAAHDAATVAQRGPRGRWCTRRARGATSDLAREDTRGDTRGNTTRTRREHDGPGTNARRLFALTKAIWSPTARAVAPSSRAERDAAVHHAPDRFRAHHRARRPRQARLPDDRA